MIYFIAEENGDYVKIGVTGGSVSRRLKGLQSSCPLRLCIVGILKGGEKEEAELHKLFAHLRRSGEWFVFSEEIRQFLIKKAGFNYFDPKNIRIKNPAWHKRLRPTCAREWYYG